MADKFTVWCKQKPTDPLLQRGARSWDEPAEAVDYAENWLRHYGTAGVSFVEIRFNGDTEPHTVVTLIDDEEPPTYGIWNSPSAMWPIYYGDNPYGVMLDGNPFPDGGKHKQDDDSDKMKLDGTDDEPEPDTESEGDSEEFPDDDEGDEDEESEEDENTEKGSEDSDDDSDEDEGSDEEEENGLDDEDGENETDQEEKEMPRLKIFGKMRGPKGWRKRAEAEDLLDRNVFALKVGVLDPEAEKPGQQERNVLAHVEFIESDETRGHGILKLRLPSGVTIEDFTQTKAGVISVKVPYTD